jgi:hypothetical protein
MSSHDAPTFSASSFLASAMLQLKTIKYDFACGVRVYSVEFRIGHQNISVEDNGYRNLCMETSGYGIAL